MKRAWPDNCDPGVVLKRSGVREQRQEHGMGLLRTILRDSGVATNLLSLRLLLSWRELAKGLAGCDVLLMNFRSCTFPCA